jgi:Xaa-Pro aminopeptidase
MQQDNLDALLVVGAGFHNPAMVYLTGGANVTQAELLKARGRPPVLYCWPIERDEAARTGLETCVIEMQQFSQDLKESGGDLAQATAWRLARTLAATGLEAGRVALFGMMDAGMTFAVCMALQAALPQMQLVGQSDPSVILNAMATKDEAEIARIRGIGRITAEVMAETANFLTGCRVRDETLLKSDDEALTIGDVRRRINLWLTQRGVENPEMTIFAIGHDAGVPHSVGNDAEAIRLGRTIVYDIFPCEAGGGYFYDMTRTWCLGYAPDEAQKLYDNVRSVYDQLYRELRLGAPARRYQLRCCELFEALGHSTVGSNPQTENGYVHSLGHGVGLNLHESPIMRAGAPESETLQPGMVVTLEPGLYYPERGLGVRLEDTLWVRPDGVFEPLADFPMDLVLPMKTR